LSQLIFNYKPKVSCIIDWSKIILIETKGRPFSRLRVKTAIPEKIRKKLCAKMNTEH